MTPRITSALLLLAFSSPLYAGVVFEVEIIDRMMSDGASHTMFTKLDNKNIKINVDGPQGGDTDMIYRGVSREMIAVDHERESYVVIDEAAIEQLIAKLNSFEAQIQQALKNVPEDQRPMIEQMMKQQMPEQMAAPVRPVTEIEHTGDSDNKNGFDCEKVLLYKDGVLSKEFCVTDWDNVEGGHDAMAAFEDMAEFIEDLQNAMPDFAQSPDSGNNAYEHLEEIGGFPVSTLEFADDGTLIGESYLKSSREEDISPDEFSPPPNYTRQRMFQ